MWAVGALFGLLGLCGCAGHFGDPFSWDVAEANRQNIAAMAERPTDLVMGRGAPGGDGALAARAVERLRQGRTRPLPATSTTSTTFGGTDAATTPGPALEAPGTAPAAAATTTTAP